MVLDAVQADVRVSAFFFYLCMHLNGTIFLHQTMKLSTVLANQTYYLKHFLIFFNEIQSTYEQFKRFINKHFETFDLTKLFFYGLS